jgi:GNAT superfamily N-acetyltransferase
MNCVQQKRADLFVDMWADLPVEDVPAPAELEIYRLRAVGGVPTLLALHNEAYVGAPDYRRAGWVEALALQTAKGYDPSLIFVGCWNNRPVGFCMARKCGQTGRIAGLAVKPDWRRRGFGSALIRHTLAELYERGVLRVTLNVGAASDESRSIYRSVGFREG